MQTNPGFQGVSWDPPPPPPGSGGVTPFSLMLFRMVPPENQGPPRPRWSLTFGRDHPEKHHSITEELPGPCTQ